MRGRKRRLAALLLAASVLAGCDWMDGSYVSVTPHQVAVSQTPDAGARMVGSYTQLRSALISMIDDGAEAGLFSLAEYPREDVLADMERAVAYAMGTYPVGAYAVEAIDYAVGTGLGSSAMTVDITYRADRVDIENIRTVRWISGAEAAVGDALDEMAESLVLQITGYTDMDFEALVRSYAWDNPDRIMETPEVSVGIWPASGDARVVELKLRYRTDREILRTMREHVLPVFSSAALYVSGQADQRTKFEQLHAFLMERFDYTIESSATPSHSLLCRGVGDSKAFSQVYAAMCRRIGLEALSVSGTREGESCCWNLIRIDGSWYHLDLLGSRRFLPLTDGDMAGYDWDRAAYPAATGTPK